MGTGEAVVWKNVIVDQILLVIGSVENVVVPQDLLWVILTSFYS